MARDRETVRLSKRLSYLLRHQPEQLDLQLDEEGYTACTVEELAERMGVEPDAIRRVVETDPKGRFSIRGGRIRANYGHSIPPGRRMWTQEEPASAKELPEVLYHGTAPPNLDSIMRGGLRPRGRQFVHLSTSPEAARRVGRRHAGRPAVLSVNVGKALNAGVRMWRAGPETVLATEVPPECLRR